MPKYSCPQTVIYSLKGETQSHSFYKQHSMNVYRWPT